MYHKIYIKWRRELKMNIEKVVNRKNVVYKQIKIHVVLKIFKIKDVNHIMQYIC